MEGSVLPRLYILFPICLIRNFVPSPSPPLSLVSLPLGTIGAQHHLFLSPSHAAGHHSLRRHNPHHPTLVDLTFKSLLVHHVLKEGVLSKLSLVFDQFERPWVVNSFWGATVDVIVNLQGTPLCHICVYVYIFQVIYFQSSVFLSLAKAYKGVLFI